MSVTLLPTIYENLSAIGDTPLTCVNDKIVRTWKRLICGRSTKSRSHDSERLFRFRSSQARGNQPAIECGETCYSKGTC